MADYPVDQMSIQMRERIVLPLVTIQQYAITKVRELEAYSSQESLKILTKNWQCVVPLVLLMPDEILLSLAKIGGCIKSKKKGLRFA